jgi:hypothetical protein
LSLDIRDGGPYRGSGVLVLLDLRSGLDEEATQVGEISLQMRLDSASTCMSVGPGYGDSPLLLVWSRYVVKAVKVKGES